MKLKKYLSIGLTNHYKQAAAFATGLSFHWWFCSVSDPGYSGKTKMGTLTGPCCFHISLTQALVQEDYWYFEPL